jgi:hypothetical protein
MVYVLRPALRANRERRKYVISVVGFLCSFLLLDASEASLYALLGIERAKRADANGHISELINNSGSVELVCNQA